MVETMVVLHVNLIFPRVFLRRVFNSEYCYVIVDVIKHAIVFIDVITVFRPANLGFWISADDSFQSNY
uniref:Uncharacterized protein n=1 Tax=Ciona savignyi TaxID=51511 RepID=H2YL69_CIOSA